MKKKTKPAPEKKKLPVATSPDQLFAKKPESEKTIEVPEWGCSIVAKTLSARAVALISGSTTDADGKTDGLEFAARYMFEAIIQPKLLPPHVEALKDLDNDVFLRVFEEIRGKKKEPSIS